MMALIIDSLPGCKVVGEVSNPGEATKACARLQPDLIVMDWVMPRTSGPILLQELRSVCPRARMLVFSGNLWPAGIRAALAGGVLGIVDKMAPLEVFRAAVQAVAAGRTYFSPLVSEQIKQLVSRRPAENPQPIVLSEREKTVLAYTAEGLSSKEIAATLGISAYTVANHRANLMRKIGVRRAAQLSLYAAQMGLVGSVVSPRAVNGEVEDRLKRTRLRGDGGA